MAKLLRSLCCILLVFLLFLSFPQVSSATSLEDEGTEGNASEYRDSGSGCKGHIDDETSIKKVGSYSLKLTTIDFGGGGGICYTKSRALSSSFQWGEFSSLSLWVFRPDTVHKSFSLTLLGEGGRRGVSFDVSDQRHVWKQYNVTKAQMSGDDFRANDRITGMELRLHNTKPGNTIYLDGLEINASKPLEPSSSPIPATTMYVFGGVVAVIVVILLLVTLKTDLFLKHRTEQSKELLEEEKEIHCAFCRTKMSKVAKHCPHCGARNITD